MNSLFGTFQVLWPLATAICGSLYLKKVLCATKTVPSGGKKPFYDVISTTLERTQRGYSRLIGRENGGSLMSNHSITAIGIILKKMVGDAPYLCLAPL